MNETRHEAAERIQVLLNREPGLLTVAEETDLRTVLDENREMRAQLDALDAQYGASLYPGGPIHILDDDRVEAWRANGHARIEQRLVGTWQPADSQHDPNPAVPGPPVSNDDDSSLTC